MKERQSLFSVLALIYKHHPKDKSEQRLKLRGDKSSLQTRSSVDQRSTDINGFVF